NFSFVEASCISNTAGLVSERTPVCRDRNKGSLKEGNDGYDCIDSLGSVEGNGRTAKPSLRLLWPRAGAPGKRGAGIHHRGRMGAAGGHHRGRQGIPHQGRVARGEEGGSKGRRRERCAHHLRRAQIREGREEQEVSSHRARLRQLRAELHRPGRRGCRQSDRGVQGWRAPGASAQERKSQTQTNRSQSCLIGTSLSKAVRLPQDASPRERKTKSIS